MTVVDGEEVIGGGSVGVGSDDLQIKSNQIY